MMGSPSARTAVTPGNYDGVHQGHQALLKRAQQTGLPVTALFFWPHPASVLGRAQVPVPLTTTERRTDLLKAHGADTVVVLEFTPDLASRSPDSFLQDILIDELKAGVLVVGPDFRFGHQAKGNVEFLRSHADELQYSLEVVGPITCDGQRASSSRVREHLKLGEVRSAAALLNRFHDADGLVIKGDQRGRTIGVPTANLDGIQTLLPSDGVYAVWAKTASGGLHPGVANLGVRPTMNAGRSVEVHLLDFEENLYDQSLRVAFASRIRNEKKFSGLSELKMQIALDIEEARTALSGETRKKEWTQWL